MKAFAILCTLAFIGSAILGWTISGALRPSAAAEHEAPSRPMPLSDAVTRDEDLISTAEDVPGEKEALDADETPLRDRLRGSGLLAVSEASLASLRVDAIGFDGNLSEEVIEFFSLDSGEAERLNQALANARESLSAMELDRMETIRATPEELVLLIPAFEEEGLKEEAALRNAFIRELGEQDGELLWNFTERRDRPGGDYWHGFGRVSRELTFRLEPSEKSPAGAILHFSSETSAEERRRWFESEGRQLGGFVKEMHRVPSPEWATRFLGRYEYLVPLLPEKVGSYLNPPAEPE